jgi:hypothetical protein
VSQVIPYFSETLTYSSGIDEPLRSASDSSRKNPSNPGGEKNSKKRPVRGTTLRWA